jgi:RimJ/RimL family protein N-acetyltransferase
MAHTRLVAPFPETLTGEVVTLRRYRASDVDAVREAMDASFAELRRWMPWAQSRPTRRSVADFVHPAALRFGTAPETNYAITLTDGHRFVGSCGLMSRVGPRALEIGYWVDSRYTRRGIATAAARLLTDAAFARPDVDRVEIHCDEANIASAGVPRKLGYRLDRIARDGAAAPDDTGREMVWIVERAGWTPDRSGQAARLDELG